MAAKTSAASFESSTASVGALSAVSGMIVCERQSKSRELIVGAASTSKKTAQASASTVSHESQQSSSRDDLTFERLEVSDLGLFGRDKELNTLATCLDKIVTKQVERQLVMISGVSGTGKSTLANSLLDSVKQHNGMLVRGKFDLHLRNEPYAGIASACAEICGHIQALQAQEPPRFEQVCGRIKEELGSELALLNQAISVLGEIIDPPKEDASIAVAATAAASSAEAKSRFQFAFQRFVRVISEQFSPFVMVLDDLHWADRASLDLLDALISDRGNSGIMVIGIYRSNEVNETQAFHDLLEEFQFKVHDNIFELTEVFIDDLDIGAVHDIIQALLSVEASMEDCAETQGLAQVCFQKTNGNAFFLVHLLLTLHENGLLTYNSETLSWDWDEQEIEKNTKASTNVVEMLKTKMAAQPDLNIEIMKVAACLGSTFEEKTLRLVCQAMDVKGPNKSTIASGLESLEQEGFIQKQTDASRTARSFTWSHDKIQEAALTLISDRMGFSHHIGEILLLGLDEDEIESSIFVVANLLNCGEMTGKDKKLKLAHINRDAGRKAVSLSAFDSAADFAERGIKLLPVTRWRDEHYALSLELYSIGAQAEAYLGNVEKMEKYCQEVLAQDDRPLQDKLPVYNTWVDSISNRGKMGGAAELLLHLLEKFDCRFSKSSLSIGLGILSNLVRIKSGINSLQSVEHEEMTDTTKIQLMKLLDKLTTCLYMVKDDRMPLVVFRSLNWTNTFGFCDYSPACYALTGVILTGILNDIQGGSIYGEKALELLEKSQATICASRTMFLVNNLLFSWTKPIREVVPPLVHAYRVGMQIGDSESALWAANTSLQNRFFGGCPLEPLEADFQLYCNQMKDLKRRQHLRTSNYTRQAALNLLGRNEEGPVTELVGQVCTRKDIDEYKQDPFHSVRPVDILWRTCGAR